VAKSTDSRNFVWISRCGCLIALFCHLLAGNASFAQEPFAQRLWTQHFPVQNSSEKDATISSVSPTLSYPNKAHPFFDRENIWLFAGVGASRTVDYFSTLNMRRRGRQEILLSNWVVDRHGLFAGIEAGGTALSIGASYWLHRTGHHRLERAFSMVHISLATTGAVRNYSLKTFHSASRGLD
jgi:hypothetical protein